MGTPVAPYTRPVTGRVFRRSLDPDLPVAVEARDATIRDAAGREYLDAAGGAIVVNVGHGRASIARVLGEQTARLAVRPRLARSRPSRSRPTPRRSGRTCRSTTRRSTRSAAARRRSRPRLKLGPRVPPRPRRGRPLDRHLALGQLPRQHARRARPVGPAAAPPAVRGLARPVPARLRRRIRTAPASPDATRSASGAGARGRAGAGDRGGRAGHGRGVRRRADRRGDARGRRPAGRLLAARSRRSAGATACCSSPTR